MKSKRIVIIFLALSCAACSTIQRAEERREYNLRGQRIPAGTAEAEFFNVLVKGNLKKQDLTFTYYPEDDAVCLEYRHNLMISYYQFWSRSNRTAFVKALEQYKLDYADRNLKTKNKMQSKRQYKTEEAFMVWETSRYSTFCFGWPRLELGYQFMNNSPYFSITQRETDNEEPVTKPDNTTSENVVIYFTRAQADEVAAIFDQTYLESLKPLPPPVRPSDSIIDESYVEGDF